MRIWGTGSGASAEISTFKPAVYLAALGRQSLDPQAHRELDSLLKESDPELFFYGLIEFANREVNRDRPVSAALAYRIVAEDGAAFPELSRKARQRENALQGVGEVGPRVEFLLHNVVEEGADPAMIFGMVGAGAVFRAVRAGSLAVLADSPLAKTWLSPTTRSLAASALGFAFEAPTFTLGTHAAHEALGRPQDWSTPALARSLASGALMLGGLKIGGGGAALLERQWIGRMAPGLRLPGSAFQQGGMLAGIYLGRGIEQASGLHEKLDGATTLTDSLLTLLQFNIAGRLTPRFLNAELARWETASTAKNQNAAGPRADSLLQPRPALATAGAAAAMDPKTGLLVLSSSHDDQGRSSPPPSAPRDSAHSISSKPPAERGIITNDALAWGSSQKRSSEDVTRMVNFIEKIRVEMWNALNLYVDKPLARALGQSKTLYVRLRPVDGTLDNYQVELSATPTPREVHVDYVEWSFDANLGRLALNQIPSQVAFLQHLQSKGGDASRSFLGYYHSLRDFETSALQSAQMVAVMPANVRALVMQQATHYLRQIARANLAMPELVRTPQTVPTSTNLTNYFPYVAEMARQQVDAFADKANMQDRHRQRLQGLTQKLLVGLHARELADPRVSRFSFLMARLGPDPEEPTRRIIEVLLPNESMKRPPKNDEVIFNLVRYPSALADKFPYLHHVYLNTNPQGEATRAADLRFERALGLTSNLKIRLDALSIESFDTAAAEKWLSDNGYTKG
jgi:hypothetical protein